MTCAPDLKYFNTGEVAINYAEFGPESGQSKPGFLFIHGITGRHQAWDGIVAPVRDGNKAIAVDLRGHGRSGYVTGEYRLPDYASDMTLLIEHLGLAPVVIVGHSLGAMTAIQLAADRPELTKAIVLEDPPLYARTIMEETSPERHERFGVNARLAGSVLSVEQIGEQMRQITPDAPEEEVQRGALSLFVTDADAINHVYDQRIDWTPEIDDLMSSVKCPALLMQGNFMLGAWLRTEDGARAKGLIPNCTLEYWGDAGHGLHSHDPERFVEQVNRFVAGQAS